MSKLLVIVLVLIISCRADIAPNSYIGSVKSDKFHKLDCRWAQNIKEENKVYFGTREEATGKGRKPCQTCNP